MTEKFDLYATPYTDSFMHKDTLQKPFNYIGVARFAEQKWHENEHNLKLETQQHAQTKEKLRIAIEALKEMTLETTGYAAKVLISKQALQEIEMVGK